MAVVAVAALLSIVLMGWEGRAGPGEAVLASLTPVPGREMEGALGRKTVPAINDDGRCYCLAIPGPLQPRFEARLVRDGALLTTVGLTDRGNNLLAGQLTAADRRATTVVLDLAWNDVQDGAESEVLVSLDLEQRYARRFVPRQFRGEFRMHAPEHGRTTWQYRVRRSTSEGGVLLSIEIEPLPAADGLDLGRRLGSGHSKQ
jgi:hypothetical protein